MSELHKAVTNNINACPTTSDIVAQWAAKKNNLTTQLAEQERKKKERTAEQKAFEKYQLSRLKFSYIGLIAARVKDEWRYMGAEDGWSCDAYIIQDENGYVEAVNVQDCTIDDSDKAESFRSSIERAVYKASPLPIAPNQSVFDSEITFRFPVD